MVGKEGKGYVVWSGVGVFLAGFGEDFMYLYMLVWSYLLWFHSGGSRNCHKTIMS